MCIYGSLPVSGRRTNQDADISKKYFLDLGQGALCPGLGWTDDILWSSWCSDLEILGVDGNLADLSWSPVSIPERDCLFFTGCLGVFPSAAVQAQRIRQGKGSAYDLSGLVVGGSMSDFPCA